MYRYTKYEEANKLSGMFAVFWDEFGTTSNEVILEKIGLRQHDRDSLKSEYKFWCNMMTEKSYLQIVDNKKWLLAKIKYGI